TGNTTLSTVSTSGLATLDSASVTNNATVGGTLGVTGNTTLSTVSTTGLATLDSASVTNNATVGGTLGVTGQSYLNGGALVSNILTVAPATTFDMGGNRVQNVGAPIDATDAATKGYVDGYMGTTSYALNALNGRVNQAFKEIDENTEGIAVAMAMGGLALPDGKAFALSANMGFYDDKQALAAQGAMRLNRTFALTGGVGVGFDEGKVGGRVGVMAAW
ncbi:MAG: YadA-like family protein, partial [Methyloceanibacter sp.]